VNQRLPSPRQTPTDKRQPVIGPPGRFDHKEPPMLVLSRQRDESIIIGDNIVVTIVDIRGDKVRLGIEAPTEIPVHRREVYEAIQRENQRASQLEPKDTQRLGQSETTSSSPPKKG
jgi:carbon storage regulator